ncbi:MAG TPA: chondroitinase family polysaccharide lyase [Armatimonadota bacterium]|nr:chondroitinase family polysaccharide lyase [Armatimonadota bacterium]
MIRTVALLAMVAGIAHSQGDPAAFIGFETADDLAGWSASAGEIGLTGSRYKSGAQSLQWSWNSPDATLTYRDAAALGELVAPNGKAPGSALVMWLHNQVAAKSLIHLELLVGDDVAGRCWFVIEFTGWRPLGAPYAEILPDPMPPIDGIRIRAPSGEGQLHLDRFSANAAVAVPRSHQMPWIGVEGGLSDPSSVMVSVRDLAVNRPWLPERATVVSDAERVDMAKVAELSLPALSRSGKGASPELMAEIRRQTEAWKIRRDGDIVTGLPIDGASFIKPPDAIDVGEYMVFCGKVKDAYSQAAEGEQRDEVRDTFVLLCEHFLDQGWGYGSGLRGMGSGYVYRAYPHAFYAMRDVLAEAGLLREMALAILYQLAEGEPALAEEPFANMDRLHLSNQALLPTISMIPDDVERLHWMRIIQRYYSMALVNPKTLGPDGSAYHHWMHHYAYASYSMPFPIRAARTLADTTFRIAPRAHEHMRSYVLAMAFASVNHIQPPNMNGRAGTPQGHSLASEARALAEMGTPDGTEALDREMAGLYLTLTEDHSTEPAAAWLADGIEPLKLTGHKTMNGTAAALHRRDDWLISIVGMIKFWRGVEIYGWQQTNNYARYARNGAIYVAPGGEPPSIEAGGYSYDGWNWCHWPGTTSLVRPPHEIFNGYAMHANPTTFAGGTRLGEDGIWGMDFQGKDVHFRKSAFCFGNRITVISSDITSEEPRPAVTTLLQRSLADRSEPIWIDGARITEFPYEAQLDDGAAHSIVDSKGVGYVLHPGSGSLRVRRGEQSWTYMIEKCLRDADDNPIINYQKRQYRHETMAENEQYFEPSVGDFALAYIDHGEKPEDGACAYTILVSTTPDEANAFADAPPRILQSDSRAHVVADEATGTVGYVLFGEGDLGDELLRFNSRPCFVMARREGENLQLSVASTDIEQDDPIALMIAGKWQAATDGVSNRTEGGVSVLEVPYRDYMPVVVELRPGE